MPKYMTYRACEMMVGDGRFVDGLKAAGMEFFAGVPDSLLKSFCAHVTDDCEKCYSTTSTPPMGSDPLTQLRSWNHDSQLAHSYLCEKKAQA